MRLLRDRILTWGLRPQTPGIFRLRARIAGDRRRPWPPPAIPAAERRVKDDAQALQSFVLPLNVVNGERR